MFSESYENVKLECSGNVSMESFTKALSTALLWLLVISIVKYVYMSRKVHYDKTWAFQTYQRFNFVFLMNHFSLDRQTLKFKLASWEIHWMIKTSSFMPQTFKVSLVFNNPSGFKKIRNQFGSVCTVF